MIQHHAIIATTWSDETFDKFQEWIHLQLDDKEKKLIVTAKSWANGYRSIVLVPDGSKEGWEESNHGNLLRKRILHRLALDDHWDWIECTFGECGQKISNGNCKL